MATFQKYLVKIAAGALDIFTEVQKEEFEIQKDAQMTAYTTAIAGKVSYDFSPKRSELTKYSFKPMFRLLYSAKNEPTELLFEEYLIKHVKDLTMSK